MEFWKRRQAELEYEWDTVELQQEEQPRPEYEARCTHVVINEITQVPGTWLACSSGRVSAAALSPAGALEITGPWDTAVPSLRLR